MKSARIIAQEIAEILKGDVVAAVQVKQHFAEGELMTLLGLTDTVAQEQIVDLQDCIERKDLRIAYLHDEIEALRDDNKYLKLSR